MKMFFLTIKQKALKCPKVFLIIFEDFNSLIWFLPLLKTTGQVFPLHLFQDYLFTVFFSFQYHPLCPRIFSEVYRNVKKIEVSKLGCRVILLKYQSLEWNSSVQSADQSKFSFSLFMAEDTRVGMSLTSFFKTTFLQYFLVFNIIR